MKEILVIACFILSLLAISVTLILVMLELLSGWFALIPLAFGIISLITVLLIIK